MIEYSVLGYFGASGLYIVLSVLLLTSWRGRLQGALLLTAVLLSVLWAAGNGYSLSIELLYRYQLLALEATKNIFLCLFLLRLLDISTTGDAEHSDGNVDNSHDTNPEPNTDSIQRLKPTVVAIGVTVVVLSMFPSLRSTDDGV